MPEKSCKNCENCRLVMYKVHIYCRKFGWIEDDGSGGCCEWESEEQ
jgi:hypothetical protein